MALYKLDTIVAAERRSLVYCKCLDNCRVVLCCAVLCGPFFYCDLQEVHSACDIEGHVGNDKRYYLLDFARSFPPEDPTEVCAG